MHCAKSFKTFCLVLVADLILQRRRGRLRGVQKPACGCAGGRHWVTGERQGLGSSGFCRCSAHGSGKWQWPCTTWLLCCRQSWRSWSLGVASHGQAWWSPSRSTHSTQRSSPNSMPSRWTITWMRTTAGPWMWTSSGGPCSRPKSTVTPRCCASSTPGTPQVCALLPRQFLGE